ncbi:MAG: hypothetical protein ACRD07_22450 [Acidimicrobiales bacterium]
MDTTLAPEIPANCNPVFSIAGVMPAASEMTWKTAYPNPDSLVARPRPAGHGVSLSIAGATAGTADNGWRTAMPDPTRDVLDTYGHVISKVEAKARAQALRARQVPVLGRPAEFKNAA